MAEVCLWLSGLAIGITIRDMLEGFLAGPRRTIPEPEVSEDIEAARNRLERLWQGRAK